MDIVERSIGDRAELLRRIGREKKAKQCDRYRAVLMAFDDPPDSSSSASLRFRTICSEL